MSANWDIVMTPDALATRLEGLALVSVEFMYKPRPEAGPGQRIFDEALSARLRALGQHEQAAVVLVCRDRSVLDSLAHLPHDFPGLPMLAAFTNPEPLAEAADPHRRTPWECGWPDPDGWRHYRHTDRWARILFALECARQLAAPGCLILSAHDAVWGMNLLDTLIAHSHAQGRSRLPAAVSPYPRLQYTPVPGVEIAPIIIDALNAAFSRDTATLQARMSSGRYQGFWGKMGIIPFGMCGAILRTVEPRVWEDDLEIDRAIREAGYAVSAYWVEDAALYRQTPPVFDRDGLKAVIDRTLHYSLHIPGRTLGEHSLLNRPLDAQARARRQADPAYAESLALAEQLTAECLAEAAERIRLCGMSWVDWGDYRHVVRVGDPFVQVWKYEGRVL